MKRKNCFIIVLLSALLVAGLASMAGAATLALETSSDSVSSTVTVNVKVTDMGTADNLAGAALTIGYDSNVFEFAGTVSGEEIDVADVTSNFFSTMVSDGTISQIPMAGKDENANQKIMLSGAYVEGTSGLGMPAADAVGKILFGVQFNVVSGVTAGTTADFTVMQTQLLNPSAGWYVDANSNNTYDEGESADNVPVLMEVAPDWKTATPDNPGDDFNELLATFSPATKTVTIEEINDADNDGIPDDWEETTFSAYPDYEPTATSDFDGDGYSDLVEWQNAGTNDANGNAYNPLFFNAPDGTGYTTSSSLLGDVDGDGAYTADDVKSAFQLFASGGTPTQQQVAGNIYYENGETTLSANDVKGVFIIFANGGVPDTLY